MPASGKDGLFARAQQAEQRGNREGRDLWERYAIHRQHLTDAALAQAPAPGGRLCLLGAGNGNDLDLARFAAHFAELHLVDIDPAALARATARQSPQVRAKLHPHAPVDLSGLYRQLDASGVRKPGGAALIAAGTQAVLQQLPSDFDVVVSCCVLSQMAWALGRLSGVEAAQLPELEQALLTIHLRSLLQLIRPTGVALLVTDMVSTEAYPLEELPADADLTALVQQLSESRTSFTVSNPGFIRQLMRRDPELLAQAQLPQMGQPWIWTGSQDRTFLVYPLALRRR